MEKYWETGEEGVFAGINGIKIRYRIFLNSDEKGAIVICSGRTETMLKYKELIYDFGEKGRYSIYISGVCTWLNHYYILYSQRSLHYSVFSPVIETSVTLCCFFNVAFSYKHGKGDVYSFHVHHILHVVLVESTAYPRYIFNHRGQGLSGRMIEGKSHSDCA